MEEAFAESEERRKVHEAIYFEGSVELDNLGGVYTSNYGSVTISVERRPGQKPVIRGKYWVQRYPEQEESPSADQTQAEEPTNVPGQFAGEVDYEGGFASVDWSEGEAHGTAELQIQQNGTRISGPWKTEGSDESGHWNMTKAD
jgi:hypothetical protein